MKTSVLFMCLTLFGIESTQAAIPEARPDEYNIKAWGAIGDGKTKATVAIQKAIDACGAAGGGRILFPKGHYYSETLRLRDHVELHLVEGARLVGSADPDDYQGFQKSDWGQNRWNRGLIVGEGLSDIAITGAGVIDGNKVFDPQGEAGMRGPHTILLSDCQNVTLRGVTLRDSGNYAFFFYASTKVRVENATFEGGWDGVHFRGNMNAWNSDVQISECRFYTGDDSIAGHYIQDFQVKDCVINSSCNGVRIIGPARRGVFERCDVFGPGQFAHKTPEYTNRTNMLAGFILQPSAWTPTPGPLEDLIIRDIVMRNVACAFHVSTRDNNTADRLTFERIQATGVYSQAVSLESWTDQPLGVITLRDINIHYTPDAFSDQRMKGQPQVQSPIRKPGVGVWNRKLPVWGLYGRNAKTIQIERSRFETNAGDETRPAIRMDTVERVGLKNVHSESASSKTPFLEQNNVGSVAKEGAAQKPEPPQMRAPDQTESEGYS